MMDKRKVATEQATTTENNTDTKVQITPNMAKDLGANQQQKDYISMIGDEMANLEKQLEEMSINNDKHKADRLLFESLGYTDKDQFERFIKFIEKEPFNDLDPSIICPKFRFNIHAVAEISLWNNIKNPDLIYAGQKFTIYARIIR